MRLIALCAITAAYIASVTAKISIGACRTDIEQVPFSDYDQTAAYPHKLFAMDKGFFSMIKTLEGLGFVPAAEDWRCDDLATISPFKELAEEQETDDFYFENDEDFNLLFPEREDAILKYVKTGEFDSSPVDYVYLCIDPFSFPALVEQLRAFGAETSDSAISFAEALN